MESNKLPMYANTLYKAYMTIKPEVFGQLNKLKITQGLMHGVPNAKKWLVELASGMMKTKLLRE